MSQVLVSFVRTCLSRAEVIAVLTAVHMTSMLSNAVERKDLLASATLDLRPSFYELVSHGIKQYNEWKNVVFGNQK